MKERDIVDALKRQYFSKKNGVSPQWIVCEQMRASGIRGFETVDGVCCRTPEFREIDLWALQSRPKLGMPAHSFEIKVSRPDWLHELRNPSKSEFALRISNYFWLAAPKGVVKKHELPMGDGLIEVSEDGYCEKVVKASRREKQNPTWEIVLGVARRYHASCAPSPSKEPKP